MSSVPDRLNQIRKLTEVSRAITDAASIDEVFRLTVERAADLLGAEQSLLLITGHDGLLSLSSSHGVDPALGDGFRTPLDEGLIARLASLVGARPEFFLGVPLVVAGEIKGVLVVILRGTSAGAAEDEWMLSALADQAAIAVEKMRLGELADFRERLIGIVSHDLRDPLNTIHMAAGILLMREGLGEPETDLARKISVSASRGARLIDQLLDLTRSRLGGGIPIETRAFDMNEVFRQVAGEMSLKNPDRPVHVVVRGDVTGVWDRDRISQLLGNLTGNAVQFGEPRSAIELRMSGEEDDVVLEVGSHGKPIPPETMPFLFDAFRKDRTTHRSRKQGLGLGLFIAQQIARSHGGSITVTSSESDGTTFRVRLPRGHAAPLASAASRATLEG